MNEFVLFFRMDITTTEAQPTQEQMKIYMEQWSVWIDSISAKKQLAEGGNHLSRKGKVLRPNDNVTNMPYTEHKESLTGYIIILAKNMDDATKIAKECPILQGTGTSVEIRQIG